MVFKIPPPAGSLKKNRFEFELGEEVLSLPKLEFVPPEGEDYLDESSEKGLTRYQFIQGFMAAIDPDLGKKVAAARLARDQLYALYDAWTSASKVTPGESSASESS